MKPGQKISKNFALDRQIKDIGDLSNVLQNQPSIYWQDRILPSGFVLGWSIHMVNGYLKHGLFWTIKRK